MMPPEIAFGTYHILSVDIKSTIDLDWFGEVVPAPGDLVDDSSVGCIEIIPYWRDVQKIVRA